MDWIALRGKVLDFLKKYRYVALVLAIGLVLMMIPGKKDTNEEVPQTAAPEEKEPSVSEQLASLLSQIDGAGRVQVMLTIAAGEETVYQTDQDISTGNETGSTSWDTVTVTDAQRNQSGLIRQVNPPSYLGAIVVCQGADSPAVRLAIVEAVSKVTGLGTDRISVLKMK